MRGQPCREKLLSQEDPSSSRILLPRTELYPSGIWSIENDLLPTILDSALDPLRIEDKLLAEIINRRSKRSSLAKEKIIQDSVEDMDDVDDLPLPNSEYEHDKSNEPQVNQNDTLLAHSRLLNGTQFPNRL